MPRGIALPRRLPSLGTAVGLGTFPVSGGEVRGGVEKGVEPHPEAHGRQLVWRYWPVIIKWARAGLLMNVEIMELPQAPEA